MEEPQRVRESVKISFTSARLDMTPKHALEMPTVLQVLARPKIQAYEDGNIQMLRDRQMMAKNISCMIVPGAKAG